MRTKFHVFLPEKLKGITRKSHPPQQLIHHLNIQNSYSGFEYIISPRRRGTSRGRGLRPARLQQYNRNQLDDDSNPLSNNLSLFLAFSLTLSIDCDSTFRSHYCTTKSTSNWWVQPGCQRDGISASRRLGSGSWQVFWSENNYSQLSEPQFGGLPNYVNCIREPVLQSSANGIEMFSTVAKFR